MLPRACEKHTEVGLWVVLGAHILIFTRVFSLFSLLQCWSVLRDRNLHSLTLCTLCLCIFVLNQHGALLLLRKP